MSAESLPLGKKVCGLCFGKWDGDRMSCMGCDHGLVSEDMPPIPATVRAQVVEFHKAFNVPIPSKPAVPKTDRVRLRARLDFEESFELLEACGANSQWLDLAKRAVANAIDSIEAANVDIVAVADALADKDYINAGTWLEFGINSEPVAAEVHRSNRTKFGSEVREDGKILKGPNYKPPRIEQALREQGWVDES